MEKVVNPAVFAGITISKLAGGQDTVLRRKSEHACSLKGVFGSFSKKLPSYQDHEWFVVL
jgi:hypothetical protein